MLSAEGESDKELTNANGRTIYGECLTKCNTSFISFDDIYEDEETKEM